MSNPKVNPNIGPMTVVVGALIAAAVVVGILVFAALKAGVL